jgi:hypothetical protein
MRLLGCSWRVTEALDVFAGEARGDSWLALNLRVVAITARTSGAKASRLAPLENSRAEKNPLKTISYRDCRTVAHGTVVARAKRPAVVSSHGCHLAELVAVSP